MPKINAATAIAATAAKPARGKRAPVEVTKSKEAIVNEMATTIWTQLFLPDEQDGEKNAANHKTASDMLQKLTQALRERRDDSKPVQRERRDTEAVIANSIGKTLGELQTAYVALPIATAKGGAVITDRINMPKLRSFVENEAHPYHKAANDFMKANKLRFVERDGKGRGKAPVALEKVQ